MVSSPWCGERKGILSHGKQSLYFFPWDSHRGLHIHEFDPFHGSFYRLLFIRGIMDRHGIEIPERLLHSMKSEPFPGSCVTWAPTTPPGRKTGYFRSEKRIFGRLQITCGRTSSKTLRPASQSALKFPKMR